MAKKKRQTSEYMALIKDKVANPKKYYATSKPKEKKPAKIGDHDYSDGDSVNQRSPSPTGTKDVPAFIRRPTSAKVGSSVIQRNISK